VSRSISFTLTGLPWSANERHRRHWRQVHEHDEEWKTAAAFEARNAIHLSGNRRLHGRVHRHDSTKAFAECCFEEGIDGAPFERARVTLTFLFPRRTRHDPDNYAAGAKGLLDGLVGVLIKDDDFDHMELVLRATHAPGVMAVQVQVEPM
jgi:hypothetical protein